MKDEIETEAVAIPVVELESKRFKTLADAKDYVNQFEITDSIQECGQATFKDGLLKLPGQEELMFTKDSWPAFVRTIIPGASRFLNYACPPDLRNDIVNRMLKENGGMKRMVRVEKIKGDNRPYIKAFLSDGYRPYNNQTFIDYIQANAKGRELRPSIDGGAVSVNFINPRAKVELKDHGQDRIINLGITYKNSEDGSTSISANPFTFDRFCENGCIFGKKFLEAMSQRIIHRGEGLDARVDLLMVKADDDSMKVLKKAYINLQQTAMTALYFKHISQLAIYPMKIVTQKAFGEAIPFSENESRFGFYNRINEYAHKGTATEGKRLEFERLAGLIVEENLLV